MSTPAPGTTGSSTKGERTREALLRAAITRFAADGYRSASVADIARDAGVGPSAAYAYFPNKEALFVAAVDEDTAAIVRDHVVVDTLDGDWPASILLGLLGALDDHPLARRVLAGLEPDFTVRLLTIPALEQVRKDVCEVLRSEQVTGAVRSDIDPEQIAGGLLHVTLSLLMSLIQTGGDAVAVASDGIRAVFEATLRPPALP